jgi:protein-S-isoprenylcysteine O-methyltransferase Ste14
MGTRAYRIACLVWPLMAVPGIYFWREIFSVRWTSPWWLQLIGVAILAAGIALFRAATRVMPFKTLVGIPELDPTHNTQPVLDTGIYAHTRNPVYLAHALFILAAAAISGFAANWALVALDAVAMPLMVRVEERELLDRLGEPYAAYLRRVPRFFL